MVALKKPDAVIFDWDNTLVDTWPIIYAALVETFKEFDLEPWTLEMVKTNVKKSMRDSFPLVFGKDWQRAADIYQTAYRASALDNLAPLPGSEDTLIAIRERAIPMFVVSNKKGDNLRAELDRLGWNHYFLSVVGAGDAAHDKPHVAPALHAIAPHGFTETGNIWFVGDSDVDLQCAKNLGCVPILYGDHATTLEGYNSADLNGFAYTHHALAHGDLQQLFHF